MRAFLSDAERRRYHYGDNKPEVTRCVCVDCVAFLASLGLKEAQTIIAEAEPFRRGGADYSAWPARWGMLGQRSRDDQPTRAAREALTESLARFIEAF